MNTKTILTELYSERDRIDKAISALEALDSVVTPAHAVKKTASAKAVTTAPKKRVLSAEARHRISEASKRRWAKQKGAAASKKAAKKAAKKTAKSTGDKTPF